MDLCSYHLLQFKYSLMVRRHVTVVVLDYYFVEPEEVENISIAQINGGVVIQWDEPSLQSLADNITVSWMATCDEVVCVDKERTVAGDTISLLLGDDLISGLRYDTMIWVNNLLGSSQNSIDVFMLSKIGQFIHTQVSISHHCIHNT